MNTRLVIVLVVLAATSVLTACKVAVVVVEGGYVYSAFNGECPEGEICIVEVNDTNFSERFTAIPAAGWYFEKWNSGGSFLCAGSTSPACFVSSVEAAGHPDFEALIASSYTFYLMPVFKPFPDTITVDGKEWLQVERFSGLTWDEIDEVCPANSGGTCVNGGTLNGYDMTAWTWASADEVYGLFNYYIGSPILSSGRDWLFEEESSWAPAFYSDGWRPANPLDSIFWRLTTGFSRTISIEGLSLRLHILDCVASCFGVPDDVIGTRGEPSSYLDDGAWFYR